MDFVSDVISVRKLTRQEFITQLDLSFNEDNFSLPQLTHRFDYGKSLNQMEAVNVPKIHDDANITGKGVMITNIDDGFEWKTHQSLRLLMY